MFNSPWSFTGFPTVCLPIGRFADGLPLGIQLVGRAADEATLLALSTQLEEAAPWAHRRPQMVRGAGAGA